LFFVVFPVVYMKSILFVFLFLLLSILIVRNKWNSISIFDNIFIILFATVSCVRHNMIRQFKKVFFNGIEKRDQRACIRWVRENIVSKCVLTFRRYLYIITSFQLTVLHVVVLHAHKCRIRIRLGVAIAVTENFHIFFIFLFTHDEI